MKRYLLVIILLPVCLLLTACSHLKSDSRKEGTRTYGLDETEGFGYEGMTANRLKAPYDQTYYFALNKYDVVANDIESIIVQANYLVSHPSAKVRLEGNCDQRGSREYNIALGWKRAKAVAEILKQHGVRDTQIAMVSYGKEKPVAFGNDESAYRLNRRVDLIYEAK